MTANRGVRNVIIQTCPVYQCFGEMEVHSRNYLDAFCPECECPMWPIELGFTGNNRDDVKEFARTHDREGKLKRSGE